MLVLPTPESPITTIFKNDFVFDPELEVACPTVPYVRLFPLEKLVPRYMSFSGMKLAPYSIFSFFLRDHDYYSSVAVDVCRLA